MTASRPRIGGSAAASGAGVLLLAALAGCSGGSGEAAPPAVSTSPSRPVASSSATGTSAAGALLPNRPGSPPIPWDTTRATVNAPQPTSVPSRPSGAARLSVLLDDGSGTRATWTLTCGPAGGDHPDPVKACGVLGANGTAAFTATPAGTMCSQIYGGPQQATVTGTWRGAAIDSRFNLVDGCQVARWNLVLGLLPPGGLP